MKQGLLIRPEDVDCVKEIYDYYNIEMPDSLAQAIANFKKNPSPETQRTLKLELTTGVQKFKEVDSISEIFEPLIKASSEVAYDMQFDKDVQEMLEDNED